MSEEGKNKQSNHFITINKNDLYILHEMIEDLESYYRSEVFIKHNGLTKVGAKNHNIMKLKNILNDFPSASSGQRK